jgi:hypothetical protein
MQEPWLRDLVGPNVFEIDSWSERLNFCTAECFCLVRMEEIFDVVVSYPDSLASVLELKQVLERTKMHSQLATSLRDSLIRRLNHPGANTSQVSALSRVSNQRLSHTNPVWLPLPIGDVIRL